MRLEQITPNPSALGGVGMGDTLWQFRVDGDDGSYHVALLIRLEDRSRRVRSTCTCWDGFIGFADADRKPCCKHAEAAINLVKAEEAREYARLAKTV